MTEDTGPERPTDSDDAQTLTQTQTQITRREVRVRVADRIRSAIRAAGLDPETTSVHQVEYHGGMDRGLLVTLDCGQEVSA